MRGSLRVIVPVLESFCVDRWCVIGSAAARLLGAAVSVADIDLLCSQRDAETLMAHWVTQRDRGYAPAAAGRFRSHFARFDVAAMPVEVMGGLELCVAGVWQAVQVDDLLMHEITGLRVPIPTVAEQIRMLTSFGRPKDDARAAVLRQLEISPC